jgi:hypothetical protein
VNILEALGVNLGISIPPAPKEMQLIAAIAADINGFFTEFSFPNQIKKNDEISLSTQVPVINAYTPNYA